MSDSNKNPKYIGEYKDGKRDGQGTLTFPDGENYVGEWKDDKKDGQGIYTFPDGQKYVGEWKDGLYHGQGTLTFPDGKKYIGEWKDDLYHGQGTFTWPDGKECEMFYINDEHVSEEDYNSWIEQGLEERLEEIDNNPKYDIEILEDFLEYTPPPNSSRDDIDIEIRTAQETVEKLSLADKNNDILKNKVETHIRHLSTLIKDQKIKKRPYPNDLYSKDGTTKREYLNSLKDHPCPYCGSFLHFKDKDAKKWTCPTERCRGDAWPDFDEMEFLGLTYNRRRD